MKVWRRSLYSKRCRAVERIAPLAMVLYRLVVVWFANVGHKHCQFPNRPWYTKRATPWFTDMLATIKCESLREHFLQDPTIKNETDDEDDDE